MPLLSGTFLWPTGSYALAVHAPVFTLLREGGAPGLAWSGPGAFLWPVACYVYWAPAVARWRILLKCTAPGLACAAVQGLAASFTRLPPLLPLQGPTRQARAM